MFKTLQRKKLISSAFLLGFSFVAAGSLWAYFALRGRNVPLILHLNDLVGITQIGGAIWFLGVGAVGAVTVIINFILALELERRDKFTGKVLAAGTLFLGILLFLGFASIISVN